MQDKVVQQSAFYSASTKDEADSTDLSSSREPFRFISSPRFGSLTRCPLRLCGLVFGQQLSYSRLTDFVRKSQSNSVTVTIRAWKSIRPLSICASLYQSVARQAFSEILDFWTTARFFVELRFFAKYREAVVYKIEKSSFFPMYIFRCRSVPSWAPAKHASHARAQS